MMKEKKVYLAGHRGMVGSAINRKMDEAGYKNIVTRTINELNLLRQGEVENFFKKEKPEIVIIAAAKVGGIVANNTYRADFIYENLMIESNLIHGAYENKVEKLIFLGSSCIYPKLAPQPLKEEYLLTNSLEFTNEPYAIAKIAGIKLCENYYRQYVCNFYSAMPTNLYGPNDNFDLQTSHVLPALIRKFHEATLRQAQGTDRNGLLSEVEVWGSGKPKREFLYVEDLAEAILFLLENVNAKDLYENGISQINIGTGEDLTIAELADIIKNITGYKGKIKYDSTKPDGTPRKLMDVSRINNLGWKYKTSLEDGIRKSYQWFLENFS
ncbi:MAG: GDP-fucose synthetase [Ignavibacteria bacterium GWB2_35_6b]|nr:MAG: GDP-fucose synthetase [Ignavibacteria bacterium GWB2_35_6b]